jgi:hypothetical protein
MGIASEMVYGAGVPRRGSTAELNAIYMLSPEEGWAVGCADASAGVHDQDGDAREDAELEALFLHYVDGRWSRLRTPLRGRLMSMAMASTGDGWAVGEQGVIAHYDGTTWAQSGRIWPPSQQPIVRMHSPADGWIAGEGVSGTEKVPLLHYDGLGWTAATWPAELAIEAGGMGPNLYLADLALSSSGEAWAVGTLVHVRQAEEPHRPADGVILHFDGSRWMVDTIIEACPLSSVAMPATGPGWAAGRRDTLYERLGSSDTHVRSDALLLRRDGDAWAEWEHPLGPASGQPASSLWGLFMRSADDGWLVAGLLPGQTEPTLLHFDGQQWTPVVLPRIPDVRFYSIRQLWMTSAEDGWAVGTSVSTREEGRAAPHGGYFPTALPVLLRCEQGVWNIVAS